jgi:iron complex outermembrane receptor protein
MQGLVVRTKTILFFLIASFCTTQLHAQQTNARFRIISNNQPVSFATITLIHVPDTIKQENKVADSAGLVEFSVSPGKPFLVRVSAVNFQRFEKSITIKGDNPIYTLTLVPASNSLNNVVITANRPLMRQEDDKTIVDPENLAASSTNAYEIIEKTPGLFVDQDGNVYLSSTTPAIIYINGREQKMSAADIATMLKSLPPNSIASIEIMRTPSARYDASGSGGIVNIVLKKGVKIGFTGSVNMGMNQGTYGNQFLGVNLNNNNGRLSSYINLQASRRDTYEEIKSDRLFKADSVLRQDAFTRYPSNNYFLGYGIVYQLSKKWDISYDGRLSTTISHNKSNNLSEVLSTATGLSSLSNENLVSNTGHNYSISQGTNLKYKIDSAGSEWTTDLSFSMAPNTTTQDITTNYLKPAAPAQSGYGSIDNRLYFFTAQTNLVKKLPGQITIETGLKSTNVRFGNTTDYVVYRNGQTIVDKSRSGAYDYDEGIHSAYLQGSKRISGVILKVGARLENTNMNGHQLSPSDTSFSLHRTDLFPYVYLSKGIMKISGYELRAFLVYRRTLARPAYENLNPSARYIDPYLFETGNPTLRPQFTQNYEANISVDERPLFAIGINDTKDIFTQVIYPFPGDSTGKIAMRTYDNLGTNKETYLRLLGAIPPGKRYFFVLGAQYNHTFYNGLYQTEPIEFKRGSWTFFTYQTFKITPLSQLSLNGYVRFKGQQQFYELETFGSLNLSLTQQLLKKKLAVTASMNDIFYTSMNRFTLDQGSITAKGVRQGDTRRFGLTFRYNFGIRKREDNNYLNVESPEKSNKP